MARLTTGQRVGVNPKRRRRGSMRPSILALHQRIARQDLQRRRRYLVDQDGVIIARRPDRGLFGPGSHRKARRLPDPAPSRTAGPGQ